MQTYTKRWRIEVFFRTAKQELAFEKCHSESEAHHLAFTFNCIGHAIIYTTHNLNIIYPGDEIVKIDNLEEVFTSTSRDILYERG